MLLDAGDPPPVGVVNPQGRAPFLLIGDHAGNRVPGGMHSLGLGADEMARHIAWDIGIAGLGAELSALLDATFIHQIYSRLVIDCNRDPAAVDAMPAISDRTAVPANAALTDADRAARVAAIHAPYQAAIAKELSRRDDAGQGTILVSLHSFTAAMQGVPRPWHIGVLHSDGDASYARNVLSELQKRDDLIVGDNAPYAMDAIDYTVPLHAFATRRPYVEIEIRQDLLATTHQQTEWARLLASVLTSAESL